MDCQTLFGGKMWKGTSGDEKSHTPKAGMAKV